MRTLCLSALLLAALTAPAAEDGLTRFLSSLNVQARADSSGFSARLSTQFNVGEAQVKLVLGQVQDPADAYMVLQLGKMTRRPPEEVLPLYTRHRKGGWGAIAKECGIKPGSAEFQALKRGDFRLEGGEDRDEGRGRDKEHGKGKGKRRG
jgi:hypothetical protein